MNTSKKQKKTDNTIRCRRLFRKRKNGIRWFHCGGGQQRPTPEDRTLRESERLPIMETERRRMCAQDMVAYHADTSYETGVAQGLPTIVGGGRLATTQVQCDTEYYDE